MKVLLGYCLDKKLQNDYYLSLMPTGLVFIASYLSKKGIDVDLANFSGYTLQKISKIIKDNKYDIVALSLYTHNRHITFDVIKAVKKRYKDIITIVGGPHATFLADKIIKKIKEVDIVVKGEGEEALYYIIKHIENKSKTEIKDFINKNKIIKKTLKNISNKYTDFNGKFINVNVNEQFKYIITSRGCSYNCTYCDSPSFWERRVKLRPIKDVFDEISHIYKKYGIIYFSIRDDNFTLNKERVFQFCDYLIKNKIYIIWNCQARVDSVNIDMLIKMKQAGLEHIQYGVESGSERILQQYNKKIKIEDILNACKITRMAGVYLSIYLMVGMIDENYDDIKLTKEIIKKCLPGDTVVSPVALYPGTALYNQCVKMKKMSEDIWFKSKKAGIYLRNDSNVKKWIDELLLTTYSIRYKAWYKKSDFKKHREIAGDNWITDILEGDYYLDNEIYSNAMKLYTRVVDKYHDNPWGYLRLGKLSFIKGDYIAAIDAYSSLTKVVPKYYGGWLKLAQSYVAQGYIEKAKKAIKNAMELNPYDERVHAVFLLTKKHKL